MQSLRICWISYCNSKHRRNLSLFIPLEECSLIFIFERHLRSIGETSPDYTMRAGVPLNIPIPLSPTQQTMISGVDAMLNRHMQEELECAEKPVEANANM